MHNDPFFAFDNASVSVTRAEVNSKFAEHAHAGKKITGCSATHAKPATAQPVAKVCAWGQDCSAPWGEDMTSEKESTTEATNHGRGHAIDKP